ncbi:Peptide-N4-(N-acetyl-beta-glucosaminyl)asparagine amidase A [Cladobotryum mycophilum]|uniref:Peptide-N4-(N-acetyl-beta-glucosaminyl)asparagine amidase A n=1 Tax=Cladobotryum mycophilum TaxID=491253 RepID=A0ABR0S4P8_9HYPO
MRHVWSLASLWVAVVAGGLAAVRDLSHNADRHMNGLLASKAASSSTPASRPLECFQVQNPILLPKGVVAGGYVFDGSLKGSSPACEVTLMEYHFGNSYGHPFVGKYTPPKCPFTRVVMNLTVVSEGRQFDRLAIMYLGDTEVWRTSTAEPEESPGIAWSYLKDMTPYLSLWKEPQTLIFDLGNLVNEKYTGLFNTTLTATFINDNVRATGADPADQIVPLSARKGSQGAPSAFTYPQDNPSIPVTLPQNIKRAVVSISANGQSSEEFWWSNVPDNVANIFDNTTGPLPGHSSFREVQLYIDGQLAGLSWPFPVIFTGGISPPLHRPIVGLGAFDLREQEVDITPWLGLLCDGKQHTFSFKIVGAYDIVVPMYWALSGKLFLWLDKPGSVTRGAPPRVQVNQPNYQSNPLSIVNGDTVKYSQTVSRSIRVSSQLVRQGKILQYAWSQSFDMQNGGYLKDEGNFQQVNALYSGEDKALLNRDPYFRSKYSYPVEMVLDASGTTEDYTLKLEAQLYQGLQLTVIGQTLYSTGLEPFLHKLPTSVSGSTLSTFRKGRASFYQPNDGESSSGRGETRQTMQFGVAADAAFDAAGFNPAPLLYMRDVTAQQEALTHDDMYLYGGDSNSNNRPGAPQWRSVVEPETTNRTGGFAPLPAQLRGGVKVFLGRT